MDRLPLPAFLALALAVTLPPSPARGAPPSLTSYFPAPEGLQSGGVQLVPIHTPKGDFKAPDL